MPPFPKSALLQRLRTQIANLAPAGHGKLALDGADVDGALGGGLAIGGLHALQGAGIEEETSAVPAAFLATLLGRLACELPVFWISASCDLYAPGLIGHGLDPARLIQLRCDNDCEALGCMETLLRSAVPAAVVTEISRVSGLAGRRLQMACLGTGVTGFLVRRWPHGRRDADAITAAVTRWRLSPAPSLRDGRMPGRPRWHVELLHTHAGPPAEWILEHEDSHDATYPFRVVAGMADTPAAARRLAG